MTTGASRATRHKWHRQAVAVPWSDAPGSLRICVRCGLTRQSIPDERGGGWRVRFGIPTDSGELAFRYASKTPPCPGQPQAPLVASRVPEGELSPEARVRQEAMGFVLAVVDMATSHAPPEGMSPAAALDAYARVVERVARQHFGAEHWDAFVACMRRPRREARVH